MIVCSVIGLLTTAVLVSIFFIFAAPHIAVFRDMMEIQPTDRIDDMKRAGNVAPLPNP
jgi:hypothetical protein